MPEDGSLHLRDRHYVPTVAAIAAVYFLAARFGLALAFGPFEISAVWPPTGIALAATLLYGHRVWPAIAVGAFFANWLAPRETLASASCIAVGNTLEAACGAFLLRRVGFQRSLTRLPDVLAFVGFAVLLSTAVSATIGVTALFYFLPEHYPRSQLFADWLLWWVGDAMGSLIVAPVLLTLRDRTGDDRQLGRGLELGALFAGLLAASVVFFASRSWVAMPGRQQQHIVFPFVLWAALRFRVRAAAAAILCISAVALWGVTHGLGPFTGATLNEGLVLMQSSIAVLALTGLIVGAVAAERRRAAAERETLLANEQAARTESEERRSEIEAEARRKDEFLALLAHELRNPLAPMRTATQLLQTPGRTEATAERALRILERQIAHMAHLVDDLLDVSRITHGKVLLRMQRLDLVEIAGAAAEEHGPTLAAAGLTLGTTLASTPVWVNGDPTRLAQVIGNLLHNAGKFTPPGGQVVIEVAADPALEGARLSVRDTGVGMEPELIEHLFEPFVQADRSLGRTLGGLGLGLSLAKGLVELHGGRISASSAGSGRGSKLEIWLPLSDPPDSAEARRQSTAEPPGARPVKVLIVEDNLDAAESLQLLLQIEGHEVDVAHEASAGLETARRFRPDVVLCDIGLPGEMSGYDFAERFRSDRRMAPAFLVAVTGYGTSEDKRRSKQAGFDSHLTKPVALRELERLLKEPGSRMGSG